MNRLDPEKGYPTITVDIDYMGTICPIKFTILTDDASHVFHDGLPALCCAIENNGYGCNDVERQARQLIDVAYRSILSCVKNWGLPA